MIPYPDINPIALELGPLAIRWYGLMYLVGFAAAWWLGRRRAARPDSPVTPQQVDDLVFYGALGVILGGRIGYALFYGFDEVLRDPLRLLRLWEGGMSFHGGFLGVLAAMALYARRIQSGFFRITDFIAPLVPLGLGAGRIGNFLNAELWGRPTDLPWAVVFPQIDALPRHPSQLYEFFLEGIVLFALVWLFSSRQRPLGAVSGMFLLGYGVFRFAVEYTREPDGFLGFLWLDLTMGQWLSLPMAIAGVLMLVWAYRRADLRS